MRIYFIKFLGTLCVCAFMLLEGKGEDRDKDLISYDSVILIIKDKSIDFEKKYDYRFKINHLSIDQQIEINEQLLKWAEKEKDKSWYISLNTVLYYFYKSKKEEEKGKTYLDAALKYNTDNVDVMGALYYQLGLYYNPKDEEKGHEYFYKAIPYYEKSETKKVFLNFIYFNLGISYSNRYDTLSLKKITYKMLELPIEEEYLSYKGNVYTLASNYYSQKHHFDKKEIWLDSVIYYNQKTVELYEELKEKGRHENPISAQYQAGRNYINLAKNLTKKQEINWDTLNYYLEKGKELINPLDSNHLYSYHHNKGQIYLKKEQYKAAELAIRDAIAFLPAKDFIGKKEAHVHMYNDLAMAYRGQGDYRKALASYQRKMEIEEEITDEKRYQVIKELETKYETEKKENEILFLRQENLYQQKIKYLYIGIIVLLLTATLFIIRTLRLKRKAVTQELEIAKIKSEETELELKLKEETAARIELEKYEALLEIHFKELQIQGKEKEYEELQKEKEEIEKQIQSYSDKFDKYQITLEKMRDKTDKQSMDIIFAELKSYITKKSGDKAGKYLYKIDRLNEAFFVHLENLSNSSITSMYLKYCVGFVIDMDTKEIADCFSVEPATIRIARFRIKKRLGLGKNDDLILYLKKIAGEEYLPVS